VNRATSTYLHLAGVSALIVILLEHADLPAITGLNTVRGAALLGDHAIALLFLLSGVSIAHLTQTREMQLREYASNRLARLYSVIAPALILTVALDAIGRRLEPGLYSQWELSGSHPAAGLLTSLLCSQELWFISLRPLSNVPFWPLCYLFWYYVLYATVRYAKAPVKHLMVLGIALLIGPKILLLLPIWLLGVWAYRAIAAPIVRETGGWILVVGTGAAYAVFLLMHGPGTLSDWTLRHLGSRVYRDLGWSNIFLSDYVVAGLAVLHFMGFAAIAPRVSIRLAPCERSVRYLSSFSLSAYLFHFPLLLFFSALGERMSAGAPLAMFVIAGTLAAIWIIGTVTERRRHLLERRLVEGFAGLERRLSLRGSG